MAEMHFRGTPISPGTGCGPLFLLPSGTVSVTEYAVAGKDIEEEIRRYRTALSEVKRDMIHLREAFRGGGFDDGEAIIEGYLQILDDPLISVEVVLQIEQQNKNAEFLFYRAMDEYQEAFFKQGNAFFRERLRDLKDIQKRVLSYLQEPCIVHISGMPKGCVIFSEDPAVSDIAEIDLSSVSGFISHQGGPSSHIALLLRAKRIPFVSSIDLSPYRIPPGTEVLVDGNVGEVWSDPEEARVTGYRRLIEGKKSAPRSEIRKDNPDLTTSDGASVRLMANMETACCLEPNYPEASGVGLFRTEFLFMSHTVVPSEEEQFAVYRDIVQEMRGKPIVMRTFDLGGDKQWLGIRNEQEHNPFLGCRAIRLMLKNKSIFKAQLKALLRAASYGEMSILFPMISSLTELRESKGVLQEAKEELGCPDTYVRIGCMIEVPSAALIADLLAQECHFLSIGTNDLVQYTLAVDRGNRFLRTLYKATHPAILRLIRLIVQESDKYQTPLCICGEMAADEECIPLLLGLGIREFSVALHRLQAISAIIRSCTMTYCVELARRALLLSTPEEVEELLSETSLFLIRS